MNKKQRKSHNRRNKSGIIAVIILFVILILATIIIIWRFPKNTEVKEEEPELEQQDNSEKVFAIRGDEAFNYTPLQAGVIKSTTEYVAYFDLEGIQKYYKEVKMKAPFVVREKDYGLIADRDGYDFLLCGEEGVFYTGKTERVIANAFLAEGDYFAFIEEEQGTAGYVSIYQKQSGEKLFDCYLPDSGYPITVAFEPNAQYFDVVLLNIKGSDIGIFLWRIDFQGNRIAQKVFRQAPLINKIHYGQDGQLILSATDKIIALSADYEEIQYETEFSAIEAVKDGVGKIGLLMSEEKSGDKYLAFLNKQGTETQKFFIGGRVAAIKEFEDYLVIASGNVVYVYDVKREKEIMKKQLNEEIVNIDFINRKNLIVISKNNISRLEIN